MLCFLLCCLYTFLTLTSTVQHFIFLLPQLTVRHRPKPRLMNIHKHVMAVPQGMQHNEGSDLHNTSVTHEVSVYLDGQRLRHECHPTYLGVTLDRMLSYREHLTKTAGKLKNQNNLLIKLAGSTWGASANTLRSSALALCYSLWLDLQPVDIKSRWWSLLNRFRMEQGHRRRRFVADQLWLMKRI